MADQRGAVRRNGSLAAMLNSVAVLDRLLAALRRTLRRCSPRVVGVTATLLIVVLVAVCTPDTMAQAATLLDLNGEFTVPSYFSGGLLVAAAVVGLAAASDPVWEPPASWELLVFSGLLAFMSLDEVFVIHERLEYRIGVDWQALYLPIVLIAGILWLRLLRRLVHIDRSAATLLVLGAVAWLAAQVFEWRQYSPEGPIRYVWTIVPEEGLEMLGSLAFGLALLVLVRRLTNVDGPIG